MPHAEDFDDFYVSSRRRLVLQTFALTGDLGASRTAVRDAFVAARHHWNKIGRSADPEGWVRPRAWAMAQRRHTVRRWHKERGITTEQAALLEGLHGLTDLQRRVLILELLTDLSPIDIGRELGITVQRVEDSLHEASTAVADHLDCPTDAVRTRLTALEAVVDTVKFPRPSIIRRSGLRRRRNHALIGSFLVAGITVGAGAFVAVAAPEKPLPKPGQLVSKKMLLTTDALAAVRSQQPWNLNATTDNTQGNGINTTCQGSAFADDAGLGTWVRKFATAGAPTRRLVQTVEISNSPGAARTAYDTTLGWYAGCQVARIQLVDAYNVTGVGDQAQILRMRIPAAKNRSFVVGVARTGALTTSSVLETDTSEPGKAGNMAAVLANSVRSLCTSRVAGECVGDVQVAETMPPSSGETAGMLAIADLPAIANVNRPWAGTDPVPATRNPAATTCDNANFVKAGAPKSITRTYLIPQGRLPKRFGLTETIGRFPTGKAAARFTSQVMARMKACPDKELGSTITHEVIQKRGFRGSSFGLWRLESQVNKQQEVISYWTGIIRNGRNVAQVTLTPVSRYDVSAETFKALVGRARDRLFEAGS